MKLALPISQLIDRGNVDSFGIDVHQYRARYSFNKGIETKGRELIFHDSKGLICSDFYSNFDSLIPHFDINNFKLYSANLAPACTEYEKVKGVGFEYYGAVSRILEPQEIIDIAGWKLIYVSTFFDKVAIENSNRYPYPAHKTICNPHFLTDVVEALNVGFCFDLSHALISYYNYYNKAFGGIDVLNFLKLYPLHRCVEIHLSNAGSPDEKTDLMYDKHFAPTDFEFALLKELLPSIPGDPYVVIEYYKDLDALKKSYDRLRVMEE